MDAGAVFRINDKEVVHEVFDDEVLAINLETGTYYSLPGVSAQIWSCLLDGASVSDIAEDLAQFYEGDSTMIADEIAKFMARMVDEKLVLSTERTSSAVQSRLPRSTGEKKLFVAPVVEVYSDMQDLLLLDPIHEVDEAGWPVVKQPGGAG
jgi:Coenzyme PQQ synthesis protein D (PqqD)